MANDNKKADTGLKAQAKAGLDKVKQHTPRPGKPLTRRQRRKRRQAITWLGAVVVVTALIYLAGHLFIDRSPRIEVLDNVSEKMAAVVARTEIGRGTKPAQIEVIDDTHARPASATTALPPAVTAPAAPAPTPTKPVIANAEPLDTPPADGQTSEVLFNQAIAGLAKFVAETRERMQSLGNMIAAVNNRLRTLEKTGITAGVATSGVTAQELALSQRMALLSAHYTSGQVTRDTLQNLHTALARTDRAPMTAAAVQRLMQQTPAGGPTTREQLLLMAWRAGQMTAPQAGTADQATEQPSSSDQGWQDKLIATWNSWVSITPMDDDTTATASAWHINLTDVTNAIAAGDLTTAADRLTDADSLASDSRLDDLRLAVAQAAAQQEALRMAEQAWLTELAGPQPATVPTQHPPQPPAAMQPQPSEMQGE